MSLICCLIVLALWVRSFFAYDVWGIYPSSSEGIQLHNVEGALWLFSGYDLDSNNPLWLHYASEKRQPGGAEFEWRLYKYTDLCGVEIHLPHWFAALVFAILPSLWLFLRLRNPRAKRLRLGLCPSCGYDLRATPNRCPECGAVPVRT
jgi:hypothetical protein